MGDRVLTLRTEGDTLLVAGLDQSETERLLIPYLALDEDYAAMQVLFCQNSQLAEAVRYAPGIRVLRQDRWEALCSFIISQNNNIKRIRGIVENLCTTWASRCPAGAAPSPARRCWPALRWRSFSPCAADSGPNISCMPPGRSPPARWTWIG